MAIALIKVDVRSKATFFETLRLQHEKRQSFGECSFSLNCDDHKRHVCYVILKWESFKSLDNFLDSAPSEEIFKEWPVEKIIEILGLREIGDEFQV